MTRNDVATRARKIIYEHLDIDDIAKITDDARFIEDLGADSLDHVELLMAGEEEFDIEIADDEADSLTTFGQAVDFLAKKLGVGEPA